MESLPSAATPRRGFLRGAAGGRLFMQISGGVGGDLCRGW